MWWWTTFTASDIKAKVDYLPGVEYLFARITPDQLDLPDFVLKYDYEVRLAVGISSVSLLAFMMYKSLISLNCLLAFYIITACCHRQLAFITALLGFCQSMTMSCHSSIYLSICYDRYASVRPSIHPCHSLVHFTHCGKYIKTRQQLQCQGKCPQPIKAVITTRDIYFGIGHLSYGHALTYKY